MPVYMIRAGQHGPVKIGYSDDVASRLLKMQADNHERLTILRLFEGGVIEEAMLHEWFADNWLHGDWFGFSKAMLDDLGLQEVRTKPDELTTALRELVAASSVAASRRPPAPEPTSTEKALLTELLGGLVSISKEARAGARLTD
jgi:hypothetical protein